MSKNLTTRSEDYSKWYNELVVKADLAENSGVRGCMVIKPYGYLGKNAGRVGSNV
jgi:prolyl-tRNA synthetase